MLVLACSSTKRTDEEILPAWQRYDGPIWRVLRKNVPMDVIERDVMVLSARYGLISANEPIADYDQRMTRERASELKPATTTVLRKLLSRKDDSLVLVLGKDYLTAVEDTLLSDHRVEVARGPIGHQLHRVKIWAQSTSQRNCLPRTAGPTFIVPDWDDRVDPSFDFATEAWSGPTPAARVDQYAHELVDRPPPYDGMLVSLAQIRKKKGVLKNGAGSFDSSRSVRAQLRLPDQMMLMGDCGAFTYLDQPAPPYSPQEAVQLYDTLGFDAGASVDHIVFPGMTSADPSGRRVELTEGQLQARVEVTRRNAEIFIQTARKTRATFTPMGVVQATHAAQFAELFLEYVDMGYKYIGLGGLVPKRTEEISAILHAIWRKRQSSTEALAVKVHLFGVMRENLMPQLEALGVTSFDSASYLRKAWLRSEKNYLSSEGTWYAAIRVPFHQKLKIVDGKHTALELEGLERNALQSLIDFDAGRASLASALSSVIKYDSLLARKTNDGDRLEQAYSRTLQTRPWRTCPCPICRELGIHVVIFRGVNRNRRRGFHNLWTFKRKLEGLRDGNESFGSPDSRQPPLW